MNDKFLYKKIYNTLLNEITAGEYKNDKMLPSEKVLCNKFNVERNTLRKALQMLVDENIIEKAPGIGSKIIGNNKNNIIKKNIFYMIRSNNMSYDNIGLYHLKIFKELQEKLTENNYNLIFQPITPYVNIDSLISMIDPVALILDSYMSDDFYKQILKYNLPCISLSHYTPLMTSVISNNIDGAYTVMQKLFDNGHRKIACITGMKKYQSNTDRITGVHKARIDNDIPENDILFFEGNWLYDSGYKLGEDILNKYRKNNITAIFSFNDDMAYGCMKYLNENNIIVPDDISIVGFDNADIYNHYSIKISTVDVDTKAIVEYGCLYLFNSINNKPISVSAKIQVENSFIDNNTIYPLRI